MTAGGTDPLQAILRPLRSIVTMTRSQLTYAEEIKGTDDRMLVGAVRLNLRRRRVLHNREGHRASCSNGPASSSKAESV